MGFLSDWFDNAALKRRVDQVEVRLRKLEIKMATFEQVVSDLYTVTENIADRIEESERVNAQLREAVEQHDQERAAALASQAAEHATVLSSAVDKLRGLGQVEDNPVPDVQPVEPAPDVPAPSDPESPGSGV